MSHTAAPRFEKSKKPTKSSMEKKFWCPTVILADADYLDEITSEIVAGLARHLHREVESADLCVWLDNLALDGGLQPGENEIHVIFLHEKYSQKFYNFVPSNFEQEISGQAFKDAIGEFKLVAFPVEEIVTIELLFQQCFEHLKQQPEVERIILVGNMEEYGARVVKSCEGIEGKQIIVLGLREMKGKGFVWKNIAFSLAAALGIVPEDFEAPDEKAR